MHMYILLVCFVHFTSFCVYVHNIFVCMHMGLLNTVYVKAVIYTSLVFMQVFSTNVYMKAFHS